MLLLALAVGQIVGHAAQDVVHFLVEVPFRLEHGAADQGVEAATNDRCLFFESQVGALDPEFADKQFLEAGLDLVVTGLPGQFFKDREGCWS